MAVKEESMVLRVLTEEASSSMVEEVGFRPCLVQASISPRELFF
jgi:hypothetical protein